MPTSSSSAKCSNEGTCSSFFLSSSVRSRTAGEIRSLATRERMRNDLRFLREHEEDGSVSLL